MSRPASAALRRGKMDYAAIAREFEARRAGAPDERRGLSDSEVERKLYRVKRDPALGISYSSRTEKREKLAIINRRREEMGEKPWQCCG